jgi:hypothetical protein
LKASQITYWVGIFLEDVSRYNISGLRKEI